MRVQAPLIHGVLAPAPSSSRNTPSGSRRPTRTIGSSSQPLSETESAQVAQNLLDTSLDETVRARIVEAAEGNPLFVEQMLSMLIDDGILHPSEDGGWKLVGDLESISIPPTISALLTARLDRLAPRRTNGHRAWLGRRPGLLPRRGGVSGSR